MSMVVKSIRVEERVLAGSLMTFQLQRLQDMMWSQVVDKDMFAQLQRLQDMVWSPVVDKAKLAQLQKLRDMVRSPVVDKDMLVLWLDGTLLKVVTDLMLLSNNPLE